VLSMDSVAMGAAQPRVARQSWRRMVAKRVIFEL
jgi:hypothetical protein